MKLPAYPRTKPSGVEWLGDVPEHWDVKKMKYLSTVQTGDKDTINAVDDGEYPFYVRSQTVERIDSFTFNCEAVLTAGDGVGVGKVFHHNRSGRFDFHQRVYMMCNFRHVIGRFFFYYLREQFYKVALEGNAKSTVDSLRRPLVTDFQFTVPTLPEQWAIVAFLDRETEQVDQLLAKKRELIERLKEKRTALISRTVTRGLPPAAARAAGLPENPPLKPSGLNWLGDIPTHWGVDRLRRLCVRVTDGAHISPDLSSPDFAFVSTVDLANGEIDFEGCLQTSEECYEYLVRTGCRPFDGDVLFSKDGTVGRTAVVTKSAPFVVASSLVIISPKPKSLNSKFLNYWLNNSLLQQDILLQISGAALKRISVEKVSRLPVVVAPLPEQAAVAAYLDLETAKLDALVGKVEDAVERLQEYRTALITAAVTGKIDVRNEVAA